MRKTSEAVAPEEGETGGSRERILDAAERLAAARGYTAASISLISKASGLPASSIYWHFGSKEDLLAAVVERGVRRWLSDQPKLFAYGGDLAAFLRGISHAVSEHPDFVRLLMMLMLDRRDGVPAARQAMRAVWRRVEGDVERLLCEHFELGATKRDRDFAARLARFTMAVIDGVLIDSQIDPEGTPIPDLFADLAVAIEAVAARRDRK
jgi:AcrR family transcriptional regulator